MQIQGIRLGSAVSGVILIYVAYALRALRWKFLMNPLRPATMTSVLRATVIGFAAMALLGRPAELVRPYLIATESGNSISSQLAIWAVERIFDLAASLTLLAAALFVSAEVRALPYVTEVGRAAFVVACIIALSGVLAVFPAHDGGGRGGALQRLLMTLSPSMAGRAARFLSGLAEGASTVRDFRAFAAVAGLSVLMWTAIACAYWAVIHSFQEPLRGMGFPSVLLLMGSSLLGSMVQLPGGGVSQLIAVGVLLNVFRVPAELAVSCGIILWLTTSMSPVPVGIVLLRKEHVALKFLTQRTKQ